LGRPNALLRSLGKAVAVLVIRDLYYILGLSLSYLYVQFKNTYISQACVPIHIINISHSWGLLALHLLGMLPAYYSTPPLL